jgi:ParB family chromosome partitioning protein
MINEFGLTQDAIAHKVGRDRSSVANAVRLTHLHPDVQKLVESGTLSAGHAKVILGLESPESQIQVSKIVASRGLSVRDTEKLVDSSLVGRKRPRKSPVTSEWSALETRLQKRLGTKVTLQPKGQGGQIVIQYFSTQQLEGVVDILLS